MHAERRRGLVEDQHARAVIDRPGDGHALALAARQGADRLLRVAQVDADLGEFLGHDRIGLLRVEAPERENAPGGLAAEKEVAGDAHQRDHRQVLEHRRDALVQRLARRAEQHLVAVHEHLALGRLVHARQCLDQGRFAGAVVAKKAMHLPGIRGEGHVLQRDHRTEPPRDVPQLDDRRGIERRHHLASVALRRTRLLTRTAIRSIPPRNTWNQSVSMPV